MKEVLNLDFLSRQIFLVFVEQYFKSLLIVEVIDKNWILKFLNTV